ncbi:hypothetical protein EI94DRAFT_1702579 [Lactarius quietus]|nr:hypothetical protein EI94DRAFT_1702579 [Lactarius quietus]
MNAQAPEGMIVERASGTRFRGEGQGCGQLALPGPPFFKKRIEVAWHGHGCNEANSKGIPYQNLLPTPFLTPTIHMCESAEDCDRRWVEDWCRHANVLALLGCMSMGTHHVHHLLSTAGKTDEAHSKKG